jgi:hypothetical protein
MKNNNIVKIGSEYYRLLYKDKGILRPEDKGLWRALHVIWDGDHFGIHDDDDYLLSENGIVAKEIGWGLRREEL